MCLEILVGALMMRGNVAGLHLRTAPQGDLLGWLVAGPYPNDGALQGRPSGFATDYVGGEGGIDPSEGQPGEGGQSDTSSWRFALGTVANGLDLRSLLRTDSPGIAYCFTGLESPRAMRAHLRFGSDDGAKVFLNGALVFSRDVKRGVKRDEEDVPVELVAGYNRLLFKVEQYDGGWGLMARFTDGAGAPVAGLVQSVRLYTLVDSGPSPYRSYAGRPGSLSPVAIEEWSALQEKAALFVERLRARLSDPEALNSAIRSAAASIAKAPKDASADRATQLYEAAVKSVQRAYDHARAPLMKWAQDPGPIVQTNPVDQDYVRVLAGGRYFAHQDGSPFIPISLNHNPDWPELSESDPMGRAYDPGRTDRWFGTLADHGVNVVRLMVETPPTGNLEAPVGTFLPEHIIWLDNIFSAARRHGVRLWITPYDTFWMSLRKETSPYWTQNGGPIEHPIDFLTKPDILAAQRRRMKFLIDRYGNNDTVFAWEVMNEIDLWWEASPDQIRAWTAQMVSYVRTYEHDRWGRNHMVTISFATAEPKGENAETAFRRPDLDFATMHLYLGASRGPKPGEAEQAGIDFAAGVSYARSEIRDNRPALDGESGPIDHWIDDAHFDEEVFHEMSWDHLMVGGAGSGTRWPYRQPHRLTLGMLETLKSMGRFCAGVDWHALTGLAVSIAVQSPPGGFSEVFATHQGLIGRLRLPAASLDRHFAILWPSADPPRVFDIRAGRWLEGAVVQSGSHIDLTLPHGIDEVALWAH